jgi:uncharacterized protein
MSGYWPWWAGAIGLAAVAIGHYVLLGMSFGVSGALERLLFWRQEREVERADAQLEHFDFDAALAAATAEEFILKGAQKETTGAVSAQTTSALAPQELGGSTVSTIQRSLTTATVPPVNVVPTNPPVQPPAAVPVAKPSPVASQAVFVAFIFLGGLLASLTSGKFKLQATMGADYARIVTSDWKMWPILLVGGMLVGFGTRLCGGCSSGHGLNGCSRLQPISLLATSVFFGTAVVVSTLLLKVI